MRHAVYHKGKLQKPASFATRVYFEYDMTNGMTMSGSHCTGSYIHRFCSVFSITNKNNPMARVRY